MAKKVTTYIALIPVGSDDNVRLVKLGDGKLSRVPERHCDPVIHFIVLRVRSAQMIQCPDQPLNHDELDHWLSNLHRKVLGHSRKKSKRLRKKRFKIIFTNNRIDNFRPGFDENGARVVRTRSGTNTITFGTVATVAIVTIARIWSRR